MSKRESRKQFYTDKEREYQRMWYRYDELWKAEKDTDVWVKLDKPVLHGFTRGFILRPDIAHSKKKKDMKYLLDNFLQDVWWSNTKRFKRHKQLVQLGTWRNRVWRFKKTEQKLDTLSEKQWAKVPEHLRRYFDKVEQQVRSWDNVRVYEYVFVPQWMYIYKTEPYYYTHEKLPIEGVESESSRLNHMLWIDPKGRKYMNWSCTNAWDEVEVKHTKLLGKKQARKDIEEGLYFHENPGERQYI